MAQRMPEYYYKILPDRGFPLPRRAKTNVWQFHRTTRPNSSNNSFSRFSILEANKGLDIYVKRASLAVASSVVALRVYSDSRAVCVGSGFNLECDEQFKATILTSGTLFRAEPTLNELVPNLKVIVVLQNRELFLGQLEACDFHFNLAVVRFQANELLQHAKLGHIEDTVRIDSHSDHTRVLMPGYKLMALGRYQDRMKDIMVAPGEFSVEDCGYYCKELLKSTCRITKSGIGGPMINYAGEVVGVNFFHVDFTPFLPINIVTKWLEHFNKYGACCRLWLGMKLFNLYTLELVMLERIIQKFPDLKQGVIVDKVTPNSPAASAGIESQDIIIQCNGEVVESCLQFFDMIWDKIGKRVDLVIARLDGSHRNFSLVVNVNPTQLNRWPLPSRTPLSDKMFKYSSPANVLKFGQRKGKSRKRIIHQTATRSQSKKRKGISIHLFKRLFF